MIWLIAIACLSVGLCIGVMLRNRPAKQQMRQERRRSENARTQFERIQAALSLIHI